MIEDTSTEKKVVKKRKRRQRSGRIEKWWKSHPRGRIGVVLIAVFLGCEILLHAAGYWSIPNFLCEDGSPRTGHAYSARNKYAETGVIEATANVVCLGDGWTFGLGCPYRKTYTAVLEKKLKDEGGFPALVVNLAQPDHTSRDVAEIFLTSVKHHKADMAVIMTGFVDSVPNYLEQSFFARDAFSDKRRSPLLFIRTLVLARNVIRGLPLKMRHPDPPDRKDYVPRRLDFAGTQKAFLQIASEAQSAALPVVFVTYPKLTNQSITHPHMPLYSARNFLVSTAAESFDHPVLDLETLIPESRVDQYLLHWMLWPHPNADGHRVIAHGLFEIIEPILKKDQAKQD